LLMTFTSEDGGSHRVAEYTYLVAAVTTGHVIRSRRLLRVSLPTLAQRPRQVHCAPDSDKIC
jgi:hypothetical protein